MLLLSVIVPVYNGSKYLKDTINMLLNSEYRNIEIVVIDDGSTDNSADIVGELQKNDSRLRLYTKENEGVVSARNFGLTKAEGDYVCFADQDDFVKPFMYSRLISRIEEDNSDMAMCSSGRSINGNESVYDQQIDFLYQGNSIREKLLFPMLFNGFEAPTEYTGNHYPHIWTCVFKRSFWNASKLKFRAYVDFEDDLLVKVEALSKANRVSTISDIGYLWRVNLKSETYAHRFVENIGKKQDLLYLDMVSSMKAFNPSTEFLTKVRTITYCKQYLSAIHNLTSPEVHKTNAFIRKYYEENIYNRDFDECIQGRLLLKKGRIKPRVLLPLIGNHMTILSYEVEILLDKILLLSLNSEFLSRVERIIKR